MTKTSFLNQLREPVLSGLTRSEGWRRQQLSRIENLLEENEKEIIHSLSVDLGKPTSEAIFEIIALRQELKLAQRKLNQWMKDKHVAIPLSLRPGKAIVRREPLGCILIIGPWNYPFSLTLQPLISALAAGNTAVLKPSELSASTSKLISTIIPKYFPKDVVQVIEGDGKTAEELLLNPFDHIFFTGGSSIGKKVMAAAARNLTPVTLELGGQSPAIVIKGADISTTANRLIWGKGLNAGQTCIAPNHLLVEEEIKQPLITSMKSSIQNFYGANPLDSEHLAKIINANHFKRLSNLIDTARENNKIVIGGEYDFERLKIAPTLVEIEDINSSIMEEEIFGPILPIISVTNLDKAIEKVLAKPRPLALYLFGGNESDQEIILNKTSSGNVCVNDVVLQAGIPTLPFGGVGASGIGNYHGLAGFETFSHQKSILKKPFWPDLKFRYPPYNLNPQIIKRLLG